MRAPHLLTLAIALATTPLVFAHEGGVGAPKTWCEAPGDDTRVHEYGPNGGLFLFGPNDYSVPPCPGADPLWDGHFEYGVGGTVLLACATACGDRDPGDGALACFGAAPDHAPRTPIHVEDAVLSPLGQGVPFTVAVVAGPECGYFEIDVSMECVDACTPTFGPGSDGAYYVYVEGTTGHVVN